MELSPYSDKILSVSELNAIARAVLETRLGAVRIEGEIANLSKPASGHLYFTLKDSKAQVSCAMFRNRSFGMRFKPKAGDQVVASGKISLYEARGNYQLIVDTLEPAGAGALQQAFEVLKEKLWKEGLFEEDEKQSVPGMPATIGVITSPSGAAIRDVLHVLRRRNPLARVVIYPCAVQGEDAATQIREMVELASQRKECDALILCRGGGSIEDLWSFNDEQLARAIHACPLPVVSGVGHEIDFTIADFVADVRAPTPSAAAEMLSPNREELLQRVQQIQNQLLRLQQHQLQTRMQQLDWLSRQLSMNHPRTRIQQQLQRTNTLEMQLNTAMRKKHYQDEQRLQLQVRKLATYHPGKLLSATKEKLLHLKHRLQNAQRQTLANVEKRLNSATDKLAVLDPSNTLQRGYAIVQDESTGNLINSIELTASGQKIVTRLADGSFTATVSETQPAKR